MGDGGGLKWSIFTVSLAACTGLRCGNGRLTTPEPVKPSQIAVSPVEKISLPSFPDETPFFYFGHELDPPIPEAELLAALTDTTQEAWYLETLYEVGDDGDDAFRREVIAAGTRIEQSEAILLEGRSVLLALAYGKYPMGSAGGRCTVAALVDHAKGSQAVVMARETFCSGGRTGHSLSNRIFSLSDTIMLLQGEETRESWWDIEDGAGNTMSIEGFSTEMKFYRVDRGEFEEVLAVQYDTPYSGDSGPDCSAPHFITLPRVESWRWPHLDGRQTDAGMGLQDIVAVTNCGSEAPEGPHAKIRLWRWQSDRFVEATAAPAI